ncbi:DNA polymerase/3'-5' exonuclease PolX [bacterium]|nr:DNA polymerase/3'-5' exonuclease PolX [bacterium]
MPINNNDIARIFSQIADLLEIKGANQFRVRAYRNASRTIGGLSRNAAEIVEKGIDLTQMPGIGKDLAGKIQTIVETGTHPLLEDLQKEIPPELSRLMKIQGMGPKKIKVIYKDLGISSAEELKKAAQKHKIRSLSGFGEKTEKSIIEEIDRMKEGEKRFKLLMAEQVVEPMKDYLQKLPGVKKITVAGSYRRKKETVGDLDILAICKDGTKVMEHFVNYENVKKVISHGETRSSVVMRSGIQIDLRVLPEESYGSALHYFTGSKEHNIAVRSLAAKRDLKINEYGVFKGNQRTAGRTEEEVYNQVDLPYIPPELRENRGEIEAAQNNQLPHLLTLEDIKGDLHSHTKYTDGHFTPEEMAEAARKKGYEYLAVSDHSQHVSVANGLDKKRLAQQIEEIDKLNQKIKGVVLLKSIEVDILEDGTLDLPDEILKQLDLVICSVHYKFNLPQEKQTQRIIKALKNPYTDILAHPSGRLINERKPYEVDMEKIMHMTQDQGCFLELNAHPDRLDLTDSHCMMAKELGIKVAISTDAHSQNDLDFMRFGLGQAQRGWLEPQDVLNTYKLESLRKLLRKS